MTRLAAAAASLLVAIVAPPVAGDVRFTDVSAAAGLTHHRYYSASAHSLGVNWLDFDNDGHPDLFAVGGDPQLKPRLYRNTGDGGFEPAHHLLPRLPAYEMSGSVFADYDNDGDVDLYIYTDRVEWVLFGDNLADGPPNLLLQNQLMENGGTVRPDQPLFVEVAATAGVDDLAPQPFGPLPAYRSKAAGWLDFDRDGCIDLVVGHLVMNAPGSSANRDRLYRNNCDGTFDDATVSSGLRAEGTPSYERATLLMLGAHLNGDMWPDLYVVNVAGDYVSRSSHTDQIFHNRAGRLDEVFADWPWIGDDAQAGMGIDVADVNLDGTWDLYISDLREGTPLEEPPLGNVLYLGHPNGSLSDNAAVDAGVDGDDSWGVNFLDADNDGDEDLFVATMLGATADLFYLNMAMEQLSGRAGDGDADGDAATAATLRASFRNIAAHAGVSTPDGRGSAVADYDRDGDLDVAVVNHDGTLQLFRNDTPATNRWLQLQLTGTDSNRSAIGTVVRLQLGERELLRQIVGGSGGHSQSSLTVHFGLGQAAAAAAVEIRWPSGGVARWQHQPANQRLALIEGSVCRVVTAAGGGACEERAPGAGRG